MLKNLLSSRKFTVALAATLAWAVSLIGLDASPEQVGAILSPLYAYIVGQGIADSAKPKA